jgi:outer membrane receptor protein involved in Fe transport
MDKTLNDNWKLTARVQRGATRKYTAVLNEVRVDREFLAMDAVEIDPVTREIIGDDPGEVHGTGVIVCNVQRVGPLPSQLAAAVAGVLVPAPQGDDSLGGPEDRVPIPGPVGPDTIQNCVPMNILGQGNVSPAAAKYVLSPKWGDSVVTQDFAEALLTGDIWKGYGPGAFSMAGGVTYRQQKFWQRGQPQALMAYGPPINAPALGIRGIPGGFTGGSPNLHEFSTVPAITGGYDVWEAFTEFNLPLWQRDGGPQRFELDLAGRYSDYSTSGGIVSNKAGINFQVAAPLRLRATMSRDVREPTFSERFDLQGGGGRVNDPTRGGASFEITVTTGGNPNLEPEKADTVTAGIVYSPQRVQGLQVSVDAYRIDLTGAVGSLGQQRIVDECAAGAANLCSLVFRDSAGVISTVKNVYLNLDRAKVRGLDFELLFNTEPDFAKRRAENLSFRFLAGRLLEDSTTPLNGTKLDYSGAYNATAGATEPDFRALASARYQIGKFGIDLQQRYMSEVMLNPTWVEGRDVDDNTIQSKMYTDLSLTFDGATTQGKNWRASLTVTNLFDADPPVIPDFGQRFSTQSVSAGNYDYYGRLYSLAFDYKF